MKKLLFSKELFVALLKMSAWLARKPVCNPITKMLMRFFAFVTMKARHGAKQDNVESLVKEWQRMFAAPKTSVPITKVEKDIAYAEIRMKCPLRGTGDGAACHRMMEYDRTMVRKMGGSFEVLESQSKSGKEYCRVAIRKG